MRRVLAFGGQFIKTSAMKFIRRLFGASVEGSDGFDTQAAPDAPFVAIGDIHGRDDLLRSLCDRLRGESPGLPIVLVGDYIDRGPHSAEVLRSLKSLSDDPSAKIVCLMGNHEAMMVEFLDDPENAGSRWLLNGGAKTLESFGIDTADVPLPALRDHLRNMAGDDLLDWVRERPLMWQSGNVVVSHAGGDPARAPNPRRDHGLLWGHAKTRRVRRKDGLWMVYGHYVVETPKALPGRIEIDTGAWRTGQLTAAIIRPGEVTFLTT